MTVRSTSVFRVRFLDIAGPVWYLRTSMFSKMEELRLAAAAKVNLFLEITGRRENGYHDLRSVLAPVSLEDRLILRKTGGLIETTIGENSSIDCEALSDGGRNGDNLVTRAARLLRDRTGYRGGVSITLEKHIPIGGGLGGGSADAAATLRGLNELWGTGLTRDELSALGASVGCDVPALVHGGLVLIEGLGEKVTPLPPSSLSCLLVLVNPGFPVSTKDIYSRCTEPLTSDRVSAKGMVRSLRGGDVDLVAEGLFNGLQETVFRKYPLIKLLADALDAAGSVGTLLSGSGATVFGLARDDEHARRIADSVAREVAPNVWRKVVRVLPDGVTVAHGPLEA